MSKCACCGNPGRYWATKACYGSNWTLHRCDACGYGYVQPRPTHESIAAFYGTHGGHGRENATRLTPAEVLAREEASPGSTIDAERMVRRISARLGVGSRGSPARTLLDVGCGYGFFSRQARSAGLEVTAIEMSEHESSVARELSGVIPVATSFEAYQPAGNFHAVLMNQVLEHAIDPAGWVSKARGLLVAGGVIAIAVPNFDGVFRRVLGVRDFMIIPPAHLNYFGPRSLTRLLERSGFQHVSVEHVTRVPRDTIRRRLGSALALVRGAELLTRPLCGMVDLLRLGGIINVYATKS